jgi:hypothetical protein
VNVARFQHFIAIDWSGARGKRQKGIAVARCDLGTDPPQLVEAERRWSRPQILDWLKYELPENSLVGLDLSPGLPFDRQGGYFPGWIDSPSNAKSLWKLVDELCVDDPHLSVSSFVAHSEARRHFRHGKDDCGDRFEPGGGRLRETEKRQAKQNLSPSSCFNLVGAAQVGKSSLSGMRVLNGLNGIIPVWPFDPLPDSGSVIVEIYTSLAAREAGVPKGQSKMLTGSKLDAALKGLEEGPHTPLSRYTDHATDAILTAAWLRKVAGDETLWNPEGLADVAATEGWTFGVR